MPVGECCLKFHQMIVAHLIWMTIFVFVFFFSLFALHSPIQHRQRRRLLLVFCILQIHVVYKYEISS